MTLFRLMLATMMVVLIGYTAAVIGAHGWGLLPIFFGDIAAMGWPGQFNLDFSFMLNLAIVWILWRHGFSPAGFALALLVPLGGSAYISLYLLVMSFRVGGDTRRLMLGDARAAG